MYTHEQLLALAYANNAGDEDFVGTNDDDVIDAGPGFDTVEGNNGDDIITGGPGDDFLEGENGNDTYLFSAGFGIDTIDERGFSASDADVVEFDATIDPADLQVKTTENGFGLELSVAGTNDRLTLSGTVGYDYDRVELVRFLFDGSTFTHAQLTALAWAPTDQDDSILGDFGDNEISGGAGNDLLRGDDGNDRLIGGTGNDDKQGGSGDDTYFFAPGFGNDVINENGDGIDTIEFGAGIIAADLIFEVVDQNDLRIRINGSSDSILIDGQLQSDNDQVETILLSDGSSLDLLAAVSGLLGGTAGDDEITGTAGNDVLAGLAGNDLLIGRDGDDILTGGADNDRLEGDSGDDTYFFALGFGQDVIYDGGFSDTGDVIEFGAGIAQGDLIVERFGDADMVIRIAGTEDRILIENAFENSGRIEILRFDDGSELTGADFAALIDNSGDDRLIGSSNTPDFLDGGPGDDYIDGVNDDGNILIGGPGNDFLVGNYDIDIFRFEAGFGQDIISEDGWSHSSNRDIIEFSIDFRASDLIVETATNGLDLILSFPGGDDRITIKDGLTGSDFEVELVDFAEGVQLTWDDLLARAVPQSVGVNLSGGVSASNILAGAEGDDTITGLAIASELFGNAGNDLITGGDLGDILSGGTGNDDLQGGLGDDVYRFSAGFGQDTVSDDSGLDAVEFDASITPGDVSIETDGTDLILRIAGTEDRLTITGGALAGAEVGISELRLDGSTLSKADMLAAAVPFNQSGQTITEPLVSDDILTGTAGPEEFSGNSGDDQIFGLGGEDRIFGGPGDDLLDGGQGMDVLDGEAGFNTYSFSPNFGLDLFYPAFFFGEEEPGSHDLIFASGIAPGDLEFLWAPDSYLGGALIITAGPNDAAYTFFYASIDGVTGDIVLDDLPPFTEISFGDGSPALTFADVLPLIQLVDINLIEGAVSTPGETLAGTEGMDEIVAQVGDNTLQGFGGIDDITGGTGFDIIIGGTGADRLFDLGGGAEFHYSAGFGIDQLFSYRGDADQTAIVFDATITTGDVTIEASRGDIVLRVGTSGDAIIIASMATLFDDEGEGGGGGDTLPGVDEIRFDDGTIWSAETILATATVLETQIIEGLDGVYPVGGDGDDVITSQGDSSVIDGAGGNDVLTGGYDTDIITGGPGDDLLQGDDFDDIYRFSAGFGQDIIDDTGWTSQGNAIEFDATIAPGDVRIEYDAALSSDIVVRINGSEDRITVREGQDDEVLAFIRFDDGTEWDQAEILARGVLPFGETVTSPASDDVLTGTVNDDILNGEQGNDELIGLAGNDALIGGTGNDIHDGGPGVDTASDARGDETYRFAPGDGRLIITDLDGNDAIEFAAGILPGDVIVRQGQSKDIILLVGSGNDRVTIVDGLIKPANRIEEVRFDDGTIWSGAQLLGFSLLGTDDSQQLLGTELGDVIAAGGGDDIVDGALGDDDIDGGAGSDLLNGGAGNDALTGGAGADRIDGGLGDDTFTYNPGDGQDTIISDDGADALVFGAGILPGDITVERKETDLILRFAGAGDRLTLEGALSSSDLPINFSSITEISFTDTADIWSVADLLALISNVPTAGDDTLIGTDNADVIDGLAGNDRIIALEGDDTISGGAGDDYLSASLGANTFDGGAGDDEVQGGQEADIIIGGPGQDYLDGNGGADIYRFAPGDGQDIIYDFDIGSIIELTGGIDPADVSISMDSSNDLVIRIAGPAEQRITVTTWFDTLPGLIAEIRFDDGTIWSDAEIRAMALSPTAGDDFMYSGSGDDTLSGGAGDDDLSGNNGNDIIDGGEGDDLLYGGNGDDDLTGGPGFDEMEGDNGNDTYRFNLGDGRDEIYDRNDIDRLIFGPGISQADLRVIDAGSNALLLLIGNDGDGVLLRSVLSASRYQIETIEFDDGSILTHSDLVDLSKAGSEFDDVIVGDGSDNTLLGNGGNDDISGEAGADTIIGGTGNDYASGGIGGDTYVFNAGDGQDLIDDAGDAGASPVDVLQINGHDLADIRFSRTGAGGADLTIRFANSSDVIVIKDGFDPASTGAIEQFEVSDSAAVLTLAQVLALVGPDAAVTGEFLIGDAGVNNLAGGDEDDYIAPGEGADTASGGAGDDIFGDIAADDSIDSYTGGSGTDTYRYLPTLNPGAAQDVITDFTPGDAGDIIRIAGNNPNPFDAEVLKVVQSGPDTQIFHVDGAGTERPILLLQGVLADDLTAFNFGGLPFIIDTTPRNDGDDNPNTLTGGPDADVIFGFGGADTISGGGGNDILAGGSEGDLIDGGVDDDLIAGDQGSDDLRGGAGDDILGGGSGDDILTGGGENIALSGNDVFKGGAGDDTNIGGSQNDTYHFGANDDSDTILDAGGLDRIIFDASVAPGDLNVVQSGDDLELQIIGGTTRITLLGAFGREATSWIETIEFSDATELSFLELLQASQLPTAGDDDLRLVTSSHLLGGNLLTNGSFEDYDAGATETGNEIRSAVIPGWLDANGFEFQLYNSGVGGVDSFDGGRWIDLEGRDGNADISQTIGGLSDGDQLRLRFDYANRADSAQSGAFEVYWNGVLVFASTQLHDEFRAADLIVAAQDGANEIRIVGLGAIDGEGASIDDVRLQPIADIASIAPVELLGGAGNDLLTGSFIAETFTGGAGDDLLRGGAGNDVYLYDKGDGQDSIEDDEGLNDIVVGPNTVPAEVSIVRDADSLAILFPGNDDRIDLIVGAASASNFRLVFDDGTILTSAQLDALAQQATTGDDLIFGTDDQSETIDGLAGDDHIITRGGDDDLAGNSGVDLLEGGLGDDTYRFNLGDGQDRVLDADGADLLLFGAGIAPGDIVVEQSSDGSALILKIDGSNDRVRIENALGTGEIETIRFDDGTEWTNADLLSLVPTALDDNLFGDANANLLEGGLGDDRASGGLGDDIYRFTRGDGRDLIRDLAQSTGDRLEIFGYTADELRFVRLGSTADDVAIRFIGSDDEIIIVDALDPDFRGIETIELEDGTSFNVSQIGQQLLLVQSTERGEVIIGTNGDDIIEASLGEDLIEGLGGNDRVFFRAGDGDDRIRLLEGGNNVLELPDYNPDDVLQAIRGGPGSDDLVITFNDSGDRIVLIGALGDDNFGTTSVTIRFADDTIWDRAAMRARALNDIDTEGDDNVEGFASDDEFIMQPGDDVAFGKAGSDSYTFAAGNGHDTIDDAEASLSDVDTLNLTGFATGDISVERLFKGSDSIVLRIAGNDADSITIIDALAEDGRGIEEYVFDDATVWDRDFIRTLLDNEDPVAIDDGFYSVITGNSLLLPIADLLSNDFDPDNDVLEIVSIDGGADGTAELDGLGNIVFTPVDGFTGATSILYRIGDGNAAFAEASVDINVRPIAEALDDAGFSVAEDEFLTIRVERLLSNDIDGDRMIIGQVLDAQNGTVSLASNGDISFTPDADYVGPAQFDYIANTPEGGVAQASVFVDVTPVNDAPVARNNSGFTTLEGQAFVIAPETLLANDSDVDGDVISILSVQSSASVQVAIDASGAIIVTPVEFVFGNASFEYTIGDPDGLTDSATVSLFIEPVNDAPVPQDDFFDETQTGDPILEDNPIVINATQLLANDSDPDGDVLTITGIRNDDGGNAQLLDNETVLFTPNANFNGEASFEYRVDDGQGGQSWAVAIIDYQPVNDNPIARDDSYQDDTLTFLRGPEEVPIEIPIIELLKNDSDPEGFGVSFENAGEAVNGDIEVLADRIIFTPDADFWGEATFAYSITDPEGLVDGGRVTLYFDNVNDAPPEAFADEIYVFEDIPTTIPISALLGNDTDVDGEVIQWIGWRPIELPGDFFQFGSAVGGEFNGILEYDVNGDLLFSPNLDATLASGFVYGITDSSGIVVEGFVDIIIEPSNDDPTVVDDVGFVSPFDIPLVINVADLLFNDFDIEVADTDGDGQVDVDLDDPDRPRPDFVGIDGVWDPAELAQGNRVSVGTFELLEFRGEEFLVARFDPGFTGQVVIEYRIADTEGLEDTGFAEAHVADVYTGQLQGTPFIDYIEGNDLSELIWGYRRDDWIVAGDGDDIIFADEGDDKVEAGLGDDDIDGGDGADEIDGGDGFDIVRFAGSNIGVRADLESRVGQGGFAQGDVYLGIEALEGTQFADDLGGDGENNSLFGLGGNDLLEGRGGIDLLFGGLGDDILDGGEGGDTKDGGEGSDTATYFFSDAAVTISLIAGTASGGWAQGDVLTSIENLIGTEFADDLTGNNQSNLINGGREDDILRGLDGNDILIGERGADQLFGGLGIDTADYTLSAAAIVIDLANGTANSGDATGDTFDSIEIVSGSYFDDEIRGDAADNVIRGNRGADIIDGRGGFDTASYALADEGVTVNLETGLGSEGEALGDQLFSIEKLVGSNWVDTFIGSAANETFDGGFGNDLTQGGFGSDIYLFGLDSGEDVITEIGDAADIDQIILSAPLTTSDVSFLRYGDDLFVELERDDGFLIDTITVTNHFLGTATGIEELVFDDGTVWDRSEIASRIREGRFNAQNDIFLLGVEDEIALIDPADLIENDAEAGLENITFVGVSGAVDGTVSVNGDGLIEFLGAQDKNGDAFFNYTVQDEFGRQSTARVEVNLSPVNDAPVANDDPLQYGVEDQLLRIRVENLLANDTDVDGDAEQENLRIVDIMPLTNLDGEDIAPYSNDDYKKPGTNVAARLDGDYIEFFPEPDHFGFAGFRYVLSDDDGATSTADVEIYFAPVNDAPRIREHRKIVRLDQTTELSVFDMMRHVYDVEGDDVTFVGLVGGADENPTSNGTLVFDEVTGLIDYTPQRLGTSIIEFEVIDALGLSSVLAYNMHVRPLNDPPNALNDYGFRTIEDTLLVIDPAELLLNDYDPNGDVLTFIETSRFAENGKVRMNDDGMIEFIPFENYNGPATFEYTIADTFGETDTATVHINILPDNAGPVLRDDVAAGIEDLTLFVIPAEAFGNDLDPDGDVIFFSQTEALGILEQRFLSPDFTVEALSGNNTELPGWLAFDEPSMTFVGVFPAGLTEPVEVAVFLRDPSNDSTYPFRFSFDPADSGDISALAGGISVESDVLDGFQIREPFALSQELGTESLSEDVTATATLADGSALPGWLTFDPATYSFEGTAPGGVTDVFDALITFTLGNRTDPDSGDPLPALDFAQTVSIDPATIAGGLGYDSDIALFDLGEGSWSASIIGGRPLPDWLTFDLDTMTFAKSGFEADDDAGLARVQVVWTPEIDQQLGEMSFLSTTRGFTLEFVLDPNEDIDPSINAILANDPFFEDQDLFALDLGAAADIDAKRESQAPLNSWLTFDADDLSFTGVPPSEYVGAVPVRLDVTGDGAGLPTMSVITEVVVDQSFTFEEFDPLTVSDDGERIDIDAPEDFNGPIVISYSAEDEKGGVSDGDAFIIFNIRPDGELPDPRDDAFDLLENGDITFAISDLLANDRDDDGDKLRVVALDQPANGALVLNLAMVILAPPASIVPLAGGTWSAELDDGSALPGWMEIDPVSGQITATVPLDMLGDLTIAFSNTDGIETREASETHAFDGNEGASVTYDPVDAFSGVDTAIYTATDGSEGTATAGIALNVQPLFDPPVAVTDQLGGFEDTPLVIDPADLLANDFDYDGDPIVFIDVRNPTNGTVSFDGTEILFTPIADFDGTASFEYLITDNTHGTSVGLVEINLASTNQAPIAVLDHFDTVEDVPFEFTIADLLGNDSDPDLDDFHLVSLQMDGDNGRILELPGGRYQFVPDEHVNGVQSFRYTISDGRLVTNGTIEFDVAPVNDAPIANADGIFFADQDTPLVIDLADLIANDRDVENNSFDIVDVFDGDNGTAEMVGNTAVFLGREGYFGDGGFFYRVTDELGATSVGYVTVIVMPEFDAPIAVSDAGFEVLEDGFIDIDPVYLMDNDYIPEDQIPTFLGLIGPGVEELENGLFRVTPEEDFFGTLTLTYAITNESGFAVPTTVTIEVLPVDDQPVAGDDAFSMVEDEPLVLFTTAVLANDFDVDRQAIIISRLLDSEGVTVEDNGIGQLVITPDANYIGDAWFEYELSDSTGATDTARVSLSIAPVNDAPVIGTIPIFAGAEDTAFDFTLAPSLVSDADGDALLLELRSPGGQPLPEWITYDNFTGEFSGTPPQDFNGEVALEFSVSDGEVETIKSVVLDFAPVNDRPEVAAELPDVSVDGTLPIDLEVASASFTDIDGDALTLTARLADGSDLPAWLSFDGTRFTGDAPAGFSETLQVEVLASDGELAIGDIFAMTVTTGGANTGPEVAVPLADIALDEDAAVDLMIPANTFNDDDGDTLTLTAQLDNGDPLPAWLSFDGSRLTGTPPANFVGALQIAIIADDGEYTNQDIFELAFTAVNDAPELVTPLGNVLVAEDTPIDIAIPATTFDDVDGDMLTLTAQLDGGDPLPAWLSFDGSRLTGTPPLDFVGSLVIAIIADDGELTASDSFTLSIGGENDAPQVAIPLADVNVDEDSDVSVTVPAGTFSDPEGDTLTLSAELVGGDPLPAWLSFDGAALTGTPPANFNGALDIEVTADDGVLTVSDSFTLTIDPVNDAPTLETPLADVNVDEDSDVSIAIPAGTFADLDGDMLTLTAQLVGGDPLPAWLSFDGTALTGTPPADFNGALDIEVTADDGALTVSDSFTLTIDPVNDAPEAMDDGVFNASGATLTLSGASLLANDSDVDGDGLTIVSVTDASAGSVTLQGDGSVLVEGLDSVTGTMTFRYTITDGLLESDALVTIQAGDDDNPFADWQQGTPEDDLIWGELNVPNMIYGAEGNDKIIGSSEDDKLAGGPGDDKLFGREGNGQFWGGTGNDRIFGGPQIDIAFYEGDFAEFTISLNAAGSKVHVQDNAPDVNGDEGLDVLAEVEFLVFGDGTIFDVEAMQVLADANVVPEVNLPLPNVNADEDTAIFIPVSVDTFIDRDGDVLTLTAQLVGGDPLPAWLSFDGTALTGTPPANFNGALDIEVIADDGALTVSDSFTLTIDPVNDAPTLETPLVDVNVDEDSDVSIAIPAGTFADLDGDMLSLTAQLVGGDPLPAWLSFDGTALTGTPPADFNGALDIEVTADDGALTVSDSFTLTIDPVNDAPEAQDDGVFDASGETFTISGASLLANDSDADGDGLTIVSVAAASAGTVSLESDGMILLTGLEGTFGEVTFDYTISDGIEFSSASVTVNLLDPYAGWQQGTPEDDLIWGELNVPNMIYGAEANDKIIGSGEDDKLAGGPGDDKLFGREGNGQFWGGQGLDRIFGGSQDDTVYYDGLFADFTISLNAAGSKVHIQDNAPNDRGDEGLDVLAAIDFAVFGDGIVVAIDPLNESGPVTFDLLAGLSQYDGWEAFTQAADDAFGGLGDDAEELIQSWLESLQFTVDDHADRVAIEEMLELSEPEPLGGIEFPPIDDMTSFA